MATTEDVTDDNQCSGLLDAIYKFTGRFIAYPSDAAHVAHVLWIAHTHLMDAWESTPRLAFLSPEPASGKTRALEISELLVPNAVEAINVTPAYLFRKVGNDDAKPRSCTTRSIRSSAPRRRRTKKSAGSSTPVIAEAPSLADVSSRKLSRPRKSPPTAPWR